MNTKPDFLSLEPLPGHPHYRLVNGAWMTREEYETSGYVVVREYTTDDGKPGRYWAASVDGIQRYGATVRAQREERRRSWQAREGAREEWSKEIERMVDRTP